MSARRYEISDEQWEQIKDMFPKAKTGRPPKDNRLMFNAIPLLSELKIADSNILADKAYGTVDIRNYISGRGASYVIPKSKDWNAYCWK